MTANEVANFVKLINQLFDRMERLEQNVIAMMAGAIEPVVPIGPVEEDDALPRVFTPSGELSTPTNPRPGTDRETPARSHGRGSGAP